MTYDDETGTDVTRCPCCRVEVLEAAFAGTARSGEVAVEAVLDRLARRAPRRMAGAWR